MPKQNRKKLNRGRFQAQGDGLEKSKPWAEKAVPTKVKGHEYIDDLKGQLRPSDLNVRRTCFERANKWVDAAPANGYVVVEPIKTSFPLIPPVKSIRVDGELYEGVAFKD